MKKLLFCLLTIGVFALTLSTAAQAQSLSSQKWVWEKSVTKASYGGKKLWVMSNNPSQFTLIFQNGKIRMTSDCCQHSCNYKVTGNLLSVDPESFADTEYRYIDNPQSYLFTEDLFEAQSYYIESDKLHIVTKEVTMIFNPAN